MGRLARLNISLDPEHAEKLERLAERTHVQPGTIARSLLAAALEQTDADPHDVVALLDGIPGADARARLGREQAESGETVPLEDL